MICTFLFTLSSKLSASPQPEIVCRPEVLFFFNFKAMKSGSNNHLHRLNLVYVEGAQTSVCPPSFFIAKKKKNKTNIPSYLIAPSAVWYRLSGTVMWAAFRQLSDMWEHVTWTWGPRARGNPALNQHKRCLTTYLVPHVHQYLNCGEKWLFMADKS